MSGYFVNGVNLDDIFELRGGRTPIASTTGYKVNGVDLNNRYLNVTHPDAVIGVVNTGFKSNGSDLINSFSLKVPHVRYRLGIVDTPEPLPGTTSTFSRGACVSKNGNYIAAHRWTGTSTSVIYVWVKNTPTTITFHSSVNTLSVDQELPMSMDDNGTRLVFLTKLIGGGRSDSAINVLVRSGTIWTLEQVILDVPFDTVHMDSFGERIFAGNGINVKIYKRTGTTWTLEQSLSSPAPAVHRIFGKSVSSNGSRLVVGEPRNASDSGDRYGRIHIYHRSGSTWSLISTFTSDTPSAVDNFGFSVSMSTDESNILVGQPSGNGKVLHFTRSSETWNRSGPEVSFFAGDSRPGNSVSISNNSKFIAGGISTASGFPGRAVSGVLPYSGNQNLLTRTKAENSAVGDDFGYKVEASSDFSTAIVTAPNEVYSSVRTGMLYVYLYQ